MRFLSALIALILAVQVHAETIRVGVAISLKEAVTDIAATYERETGDKLEFTFGSSGQIAAQIQNGAPVDVFISAAEKQVDDLAKAHLTVVDSRRVVAGNALVLVVPVDAKDAPTTFESLKNASVKKIAIGDPATVPAGQYASQVLKNLNLSDALAGRLVYGTNVRQVLSYVERGEVSAGIVYATDAKQSGDKVKIVATADGKTHDPIVYPGVVIKASSKPDPAKRLLDYLTSESAQKRFAERGFTSPPNSPATKPAE